MPEAVTKSRPAPLAQGTLAKTPLAHLLIYAWEHRLTGSLELVHEGIATATLVVIEGMLSKVRTREPVAYLGRVLLELGFIDDTTLNTSLVEVAKERRLHGQLLLRRGSIDDTMLREGLRVQLLRKLSHMFTLVPDTGFAFYDAFDLLHDYGGDDEFQADPLPVIWRAICQAPPWDHVQSALARFGDRKFRLNPRSTLERFQFREDEHALAELLGSRPMSVLELVAAERLGARTTQLLLYTLAITKQLEMVESSSPRSSRMPPPPTTTPSLLAGPPEKPAPPLDFELPYGTPAPPTFAMAKSETRTRAGSIIPPPPESRPRIESAPAPARAGFVPAPPASRPAPISRPAPASGATPASRPPGSVRIRPMSASRPDFGASSQPASQSAVAASSQDAAPPVVPEARGSAPGAGELTPELKARRQEIVDRAAGIDKEDYFQMLGLVRSAGPSDVQAAYFKLAKVWHPDRLSPALADVKDECARVFARISEAQATLSDTEKRNRYMPLLSDGGATPEAQATILNVVEAATNFQKAEVYLKRGDYAQAETFCKRALEADPKQGDYIAMVAWLESLKPDNQSPNATMRCIADLDRAIDMNPRSERSYWWRGQLHKRMQNVNAASKDFRKVVDLNPRNIDAAREVRLFEMRRGRTSAPPPASTPASRNPNGRTSQAPAAEKSGGIFGKFFKK
ncbi:MAG: DnaJ domain-containing protein [Polyangiaceae bacterium]